MSRAAMRSTCSRSLPTASWAATGAHLDRGGSQPRFRRDGEELFYVAADGQMMAVRINGDDVRVAKSVVQNAHADRTDSAWD